MTDAAHLERRIAFETQPPGATVEQARLARTAPGGRGLLVPLSSIDVGQWRDLSDHAAEPNGYALPDWALTVDALSRGRMNNDALAAFSDNSELIGLMPVISAWRAYKLPLPALVSADLWPPLGTFLLDRSRPVEAAASLIREARTAGARALVLRDVPLDGAAMQALTAALADDRLKPQVLQSHARAMLDATRDADELLRDALGSKKLKELRRQRNRLAEFGEVIYTIASTPADTLPALDVFLKLEASGWKARRGTALVQDASHAAFIRQAVHDLAARGQCQIISLYAGDTAVASAVVLRHLDRAFYFKLGVDEQFAKFSPGVQLTLELTRQMCADPDIRSVDSTAIPNHPMIDPIWRDRLAVGDVLVPLRRNDPFALSIRATLAARRAIREPVRRAIHLIRKIKEKRP